MSGSTNIDFNISLKSTQEEAIVIYGRTCQEAILNNFSIRSVMEDIDRSYMMEKDFTEDQWRARISNRFGDASKIQDVTVPIVMPQVESAVGYLTNVFLTGYPIFGVGTDVSNDAAGTMMEAIIAENSVTQKWARHLSMAFRDGLKYNLAGVEVVWSQQATASVETDVSSPTGTKPKNILWQGNKIKRLDLYNTFFDPRVAASELCEEGEFAGYNEIYSRVRFKKFLNDLTTKIPADTIRRALASQSVNSGNLTSTGNPYGYYVPTINPFPMLDNNRIRNMDWMAWANNIDYSRSANVSYSNAYLVTTLYARILPNDFGLNVPERNTPQVWKFIIVNGQVVVLAERQTNVHAYLPIFFCQPIEDGLNLQTKSFAQNVSGMQDITSALWNGFIASKRRLVTDRVLYDPMRIRAMDINSPNPSAKIPVRQSAYGKNVAEAVYQFPFRDDNANSFLQGAAQVANMANLTNQQNPAQQGQFVKGNKTRTEYEDIMGHGNTRNQLIGLAFEQQMFTPVKEVLKLNILQFQMDTDVTVPNTGQKVKISAQTLRQQQVQFKISDGILPEDKLMGTDEFQTALQVIGSSPAVGGSYNIGPLFTHIMKQRGIDLTPFQKTPEQIQYEQALGVWQQEADKAIKAGVEFKTPMPQPPPQQTPAGSNLPSQVSGGNNTGSPGTGVGNSQSQQSPSPAAAGRAATQGGGNS